MKKWILVLFISLGLVIAPAKTTHAAPVFITAIIKQIILALDQQVQRLQNKTIGLQNAQKILENALSKLKLKEISEWTNKQREQYQQYFDELWKVKSAIASIKKIKAIMERQVDLVKEYQTAYQLFKNDEHFSKEEIDYMFQVYTGIINASLKNIEQLLLVVNAFKTQMSDGQRIAFIEQAHQSTEENINDLRRFNTQNALLSLQRSRSQQEIDAVRNWYGLP